MIKFARGRWVNFLCVSAFIVSCQQPPEPGESTDDPLLENSVPPSPTRAEAGSLGGPCGKNWASCKGGTAILKKFTGLKKTNFKNNFCYMNGDKINIGISVKVPRLVNDHKLSQDDIMLDVESGPTDLHYSLYRNTMQLAEFTVRNGYTTEKWAPYESTYYGLIEAEMAIADQKGLWNKIQKELTTCGRNQKSKTTPECVACNLGLAGIAGGIAIFSAEYAAIMGGAKGMALMGMAAGADAVIGANWSCDRWCAVGECNKFLDDCIEACGIREHMCFEGCISQFTTCCRDAGGSCSGGNNGCVGSCFPF